MGRVHIRNGDPACWHCKETLGVGVDEWHDCPTGCPPDCIGCEPSLVGNPFYLRLLLKCVFNGEASVHSCGRASSAYSASETQGCVRCLALTVLAEDDQESA